MSTTRQNRRRKKRRTALKDAKLAMINSMELRSDSELRVERIRFKRSNHRQLPKLAQEVRRSKTGCPIKIARYFAMQKSSL